MKSYRVFMTRSFRECKFFEVKAETEKQAQKLAKKIADKIYNPYELRAKATDNGFCEINSVEIKRLGYHIDDNTKPFKIKRLFKGDEGNVYVRKGDEE